MLTTQLEGSHFLILTSFDHGKLHLDVDSASIKAVSKPAQIRKKIEDKKRKIERVVHTDDKEKRSKKRKRNEEVIDVVLDMQKVQEEHSHMLKQLHSLINQRQQVYSYYPYVYEQVSFAEAVPAVVGGNSRVTSNFSEISNVEVKKEEIDPEVLFEEKMKELIALYAQLNPGYRANKLSKVMTSIQKTSQQSDVEDFKMAVSNSDPLVQDELNAFCLDYLQNGHSSLEY